MPSSTVENYLKKLYAEQQRGDGTVVPMGRIAETMAVTPGTATSMVKALADSGLVEYEPRGGARLTRRGETLALHVLRRHRLVELFLVQTLGLDWSEVHDEAEELEHAISDKVLDRIDALLGFPEADPHGDPIPTAKGRLPRQALKSLNECSTGTVVRIVRVMDQDAAFLQWANRCGLTPGTLVIVQREPAADLVHVKADEETVVGLGASAAAKILVQVE